MAHNIANVTFKYVGPHASVFLVTKPTGVDRHNEQRTKTPILTRRIRLSPSDEPTAIVAFRCPRLADTWCREADIDMDGVRMLRTSVEHAQETSNSLRLSLSVVLGASCDLASRLVQYDIFFRRFKP